MSLRRYVNVGAGGGETVKHTGGGQHKTGQSAATAWHTAAFCLQATMLRFSHLDLTPASISPDSQGMLRAGDGNFLLWSLCSFTLAYTVQSTG